MTCFFISSTIFLYAPQRQKQPSEVFCEKGVLRNFAKFTGKLMGPATLLKKKVLTQVFFRKFSEISKNTFLHGIPLVAASALYLSKI